MADLQFNVTALDRATTTFLKLAEQVDRLSQKIDKLDGKKAEVKADADTKKAEAGLDNVERQVKRLDGKKATVKVDIDRSLSDSLVKVALLGRALKSLALPVAVVAAAPQIAAIGSAAVTAVGAIGALPGVLGAAGLAASTAQTAFGGLIKYFTADSAKKQREAYASLSDSGKRLADTIDTLKPKFEALRHAVQDATFKGFADQVKPLANIYLPVLQRQMVEIGRVFNVTGLSLAKFFEQKTVSADLTASLNSMRIAVTNVVLAARPLAQVFVDVLTTSSARLPNLTRGIADLAVKFAGFVNNARQSGQLGQWIDKGIETVGLLGRTVLNVGSIIMSVFRAATAEGANMVKTMAEVTGKIADALKSARGQEAIKGVFGTIRAAVAAVIPVVEALVPLLGTALAAAGQSLVKVFQILGPPLRDVAEALARSLAPVLPEIADAFGKIALALVPMVAPVIALIPAFDSLAELLAEAAKVAADFFAAMSGTGAAIFKSLVPLIHAAAEALTALLHVIEPIAPALGAITAGFLAWKAASSIAGSVQALFSALSVKIADTALSAGVLTEKFTGSAAAGQKVALAGDKMSGVFSKMGAALPIVGIALVALSAAYEEFGSKADENAQKVISGAQSLTTAIAAEQQQLERNTLWWNSAREKQDAYAAAADNVKAALDEQMAKLGPMEQLQARVAMAQTKLNDAVAQFGQHSPEARAAADELTAAKGRLESATRGAADAEQTLAEKTRDVINAQAEAAGGDIAYQQSLLRLEEAQLRAADATAQHGAKSREARQANLDLLQANLDVARAAGEKAAADAAANGVTDTSIIKSQGYKQKLLELANQASGPTRDALLKAAGAAGDAGQAADVARFGADLYMRKLADLAAQASGPTRAALEEGSRKLGEIAGSHQTAQQKADAQRAMLQRLADQTTGPTHDAIMGMIRDLDSIPRETSFTVKGVGQVSYGSPELLRAAHGGATGGIVGMGRAGITGVAYASGGVMPGYTPGRDVHHFRSATGGTLDLSGGESVMRPEWTAAVGPDYVHRANAAARQSGVHGVRRFMGGYADGGIIGGQRFAGGGIVLTGTPFQQIPGQLWNTVAGSLVSTITSHLYDAIRTLAAQAAAMAAAAAARVAGGVAIALGGGSARDWIIAHESGGRNIKNPTSTASGYYQIINGTWKAYGGSTPTAMQASFAEQTAVANRYVAARYGSWENAVAFWQRNHYYDRGGILPPGMTLAVNSTGKGERILTPAETAVYNAARATSGGDGDALVTELRVQNRLLGQLRGDVDQGGYFGALIAEVHALRAQLAQPGSSVVADAAGARYASVFGTI